MRTILNRQGWTTAWPCGSPSLSTKTPSTNRCHGSGSATLQNERGFRHDEQFKRAFEVAEAAGWLIVHDGNSVKLTFAGIRAVRRFGGQRRKCAIRCIALPAPTAPVIMQHSAWGGNLVSTKLLRMRALRLEALHQARTLFMRLCSVSPSAIIANGTSQRACYDASNELKGSSPHLSQDHAPTGVTNPN